MKHPVKVPVPRQKGKGFAPCWGWAQGLTMTGDAGAC